MSLNPNEIEIDQRAFTLFLVDGIYYLLDQNIQLCHEDMLGFCRRLSNRWIELPESEKDPYRERATEELRRLRRNSPTNVFRDALHATNADSADTRHLLDRG